MIIKARDLQTGHIGQAVRIANRQVNPYPFVLAGFDMVLWEPNPFTGPGQVLLHDRQAGRHSADPDEPIEVEP
jgi:hypothetical protein